MTFEEDLQELSRHVARLLARGGRLDQQADLPLALSGHAATVQLLRDVHRDVTRLPVQVPKDSTLEDLERDPLRLLGRLLHRHPTLPGTSLIDVLTRKTHGTTATWAGVTRFATLAHHGWETSEPRSRPRGDDAWGLIGDVASLAEAVAVLDRDLAASLEAVGRRLDAAFERAAHSGLRSAAQAVWALAASKPHHSPQLQQRDDGRVVRVRSVNDLPLAAYRLQVLLQRVSHITPLSAAQSAVALARICSTTGLAMHDAARAVPSPALTAAGAALRGEAECLSATARACRRFVSAHDADRRPLDQLSELRQYMTSHGDRWPRGRVLRDLEPLTRLALHTNDATRALVLGIRRDLTSGAWLRPALSESGQIQRWAPAAEDGESEQVQRALDMVIEKSALTKANCTQLASICGYVQRLGRRRAETGSLESEWKRPLLRR